MEISGIQKEYISIEGADYLLDMEMDIRNRKRRRVEPFCDAENSKLDEGYMSFINELQNFWEAKFVVEEEEEDEDPGYLVFLENLKEHGNAYMCEVSIEHGVSFPIIYEAENGYSTEIKRKTPLSRRDMKSGRKDVDYGNDHHNGIKRKASMSLRGDCVKEKRSLDVDKNQRTGTKYSGFGKSRSKVVDETYEKFINNIHIVGESMFYEYEDQKRVYYETNGKKPLDTDARSPTLALRRKTPSPLTSPSRAEILTHEKPTQTDLRNMLWSSDDKRKIKGKAEDGITSYWKELHNYLKKPYDQEEYDDLWKQLSTRKPVSIHRDSRSGGSERPGKLGKSYLEHYPDLKREIDKVKSERPKVLNLLRMCKFYVQKIPCLKGDIPKPWMHEKSRTILPESS